MKQFLRLGGFYCLKLTKLINRLHRQYSLYKWGTHVGSLRIPFAFLRTFFPLSPAIYYESTVAYLSRTYQNLSQNSDTGYSWLRRWQNKGRGKSGGSMLGLGKPRPMPCSSPPSVTLPSGPIPICPAYTSVKRPKSGTLAKGKRLHSGRKAYRERYGMEHGSLRGHTGDRLEPASELNANSVHTRCLLNRTGADQGSILYASSKHGVCTELPGHPGERSGKGGEMPRKRNLEESCV